MFSEDGSMIKCKRLDFMKVLGNLLQDQTTGFRNVDTLLLDAMVYLVTTYTICKLKSSISLSYQYTGYRDVIQQKRDYNSFYGKGKKKACKLLMQNVYKYQR
jgi:hypothetical protein